MVQGSTLNVIISRHSWDSRNPLQAGQKKKAGFYRNVLLCSGFVFAGASLCACSLTCERLPITKSLEKKQLLWMYFANQVEKIEILVAKVPTY